MKDIYELIRQKEADMERIRHELDALRLSARLLEENGRASASPSPAVSAPAYSATTPKSPVATQSAASPSAWATAKQVP